MLIAVALSRASSLLQRAPVGPVSPPGSYSASPTNEASPTPSQQNDGHIASLFCPSYDHGPVALLQHHDATGRRCYSPSASSLWDRCPHREALQPHPIAATDPKPGFIASKLAPTKELPVGPVSSPGSSSASPDSSYRPQARLYREQARSYKRAPCGTGVLTGKLFNPTR